ncbi:hypothetical protein IAU60_004868 [Kwoniella sp. DSM 27419]
MFEQPPVYRDQPDPSAPNVPSRITYRLITLLASAVYYFLLPPYVAYLTLVHVLLGQPFGSWTLERRISTRLAKLYVILSGWWLPPSPRGWDDWSIAPPGDWYLSQAEGTQFRLSMLMVAIRPPGQEYVRGMADTPLVKGEIRQGFWISPRNSQGAGDEPAKKGERVILHIHGGGYIRGHPLWTPFPGDIAITTGYRCLSINYRKCLSADTAFPAPLLDALAAYLYLTHDLAFDPQNVVLLAESAGAHLALFLSQYLRDLELPQPGFMALSSPWADFILSYPSYIENAAYDQLSPFRLGRSVKSAMRFYTRSARLLGYFSPARAGPETWRYLAKEGARVYIHYGGKELFRDECVALAQSMRQAGVDVTLTEDAEGLHTSGMIASTEAGRAFRRDLTQTLSSTSRSRIHVV